MIYKRSLKRMLICTLRTYRKYDKTLKIVLLASNLYRFVLAPLYKHFEATEYFFKIKKTIRNGIILIVLRGD